MLKTLLQAVCVINAINFCHGELAPFVTKCKSDDAACIKANTIKLIPMFAAGIPNVGVEPLDPAFIDFVDASKPDLKFLVKDMTVREMQHCEPLDIHREKSKSKLYMKLSCPSKMDGLYEISGQVLAINIKGNGKMQVNIPQMIVDLDIDFKETTGKDGMNYFQISKFNYKYDLKGKPEINFDGLQTENKELGDSVSELLKSSGKELVQELGDPIIRAVITKIIKAPNKFFKHVPVSELALD